jgi:hypothetical protein
LSRHAGRVSSGFSMVDHTLIVVHSDTL